MVQGGFPDIRESIETVKVNGRYQKEKLDDILIGLTIVYGVEYEIQGEMIS